MTKRQIGHTITKEGVSLVEHEPTQGNHPRFVGLDPTGRMYVAANTHSNSLVSFRIDPDTGALQPTGNKLEVARPMCVLFRQHGRERTGG